jgi:hypothetical protein
MADKPTRIDIGFQGGQVLSLRLKPGAFDSLKKALSKGGEGWHDVEAEESLVSVDLAQIVYIRQDSDEHKVGF